MIDHLNKGWKKIKLGAFVSLFGGAAFKSQDATSEGIKWLKIANVGFGNVKWDVTEYLSIEFTKGYQRYLLQAPDIVVAMTRPVLSGYLKVARLRPCDGVALLNQRVAKVIVDDGIDSEFLLQHLFTRRLASSLELALSGTDPPNLSASVLDDITIPLPPLPEQQKIATILSTWDRVIELTEKLIAAKQKRKQALMQQLLTGKVRFKEFEGKPWIRVPLDKLLKEVKRFVDWDDDAEYHLLSIRRRSGGIFDRETKVGHEIKTKVMMTTETGDFVIARMQAVHGAIAVTPPACHGKHVSGSYSTFILKDPAKLHMPFLNYISQTLAFYRLLLLSAYGVTIEKMTFNLPWFLSEKIDLPPTLEEQKRIANVFIAFDEENELLLRRLESLKQQKKGLMQTLLTGKVRVEVANQEPKHA